MEDQATDKQWNVSVNGVSVGQIDDTIMTRIDQEVRKDKRVWLSQSAEVCRCIYRAVTLSARLTPLATFGVGVLAALADAPEFNAQLAANAAGLFIQSVVLGASISTAAVFLSTVAGGTRFGYENKFSARKGHLMRLVLGVAATGEIFASRTVLTAPLRKEKA
jgi:hypothetical protein